MRSPFAWRAAGLNADKPRMAPPPTTPPRSTSLARRLAGNTLFAILDVVLMKAAAMLLYIAFVRLLPDASRDPAVAAYAIAYGWVVVLAFLEVTPIRVVLRDYPRYARSAAKRNRCLTGMAGWWIVQAVAILGGVGLITLLTEPSLPALHYVLLGLTVDFLGQSLQFWIKTTLYAAFRQALDTGLSIINSVVRVGVVVAGMLLDPSLSTFATCLLIGAAFTFSLYTVALFAVLGFRPRFDRAVLPRLRHSLQSYGLWDHLNTSVIDTLFMIDPLILEWLLRAGRTRPAEVAAYGIALKFVSMLIILPQQLTRTLQVSLANATDPQFETRSFHTILRLAVLIAAAELAVVLPLAEPLLSLLFGPGNVTADTVAFTRWLAVAMALMCVAWPCVGVINHRATLRHAFFRLYLPVLPLGLTLYVVCGWYGGPRSIAAANVAVYAVLALGIFGYMRVFTGMRGPTRLIDPHERHAVARWLGRS